MALPPFQAFLDAHREDVLRFLVASVGRAEAEDCFQETFLSALRAYPRLRDVSNLRGWVLTIAHRKAVDAFRSRARRPVPAGALPDRAVDGPDADPSVWAAVRALPPRQRDALLWRFGADMSYRDVGRAMGCSEEAARQSVHSGIRRLREGWA